MNNNVCLNYTVINKYNFLRMRVKKKIKLAL